MKEDNHVFIEDEFKKAALKAQEDVRYEVVIRNVNNTNEIIKDVVDVNFNNSVLTVVSPPAIYYYKLRHLTSWKVKRLP